MKFCVLLLKAILLLNFIRFLQQILQITWNNVKACSPKNIVLYW